MRETSIRDARNALTTLIHEAERGNPVRLTRRGKPVAVLLSDREFKRLSTSGRSRQGFAAFGQTWRREMIAKGIPFITRKEIDGLRDRRPGRKFSLGGK